jgi:hypothetical protein
MKASRVFHIAYVLGCSMHQLGLDSINFRYCKIPSYESFALQVHLQQGAYEDSAKSSHHYHAINPAICQEVPSISAFSQLNSQ